MMDYPQTDHRITAGEAIDMTERFRDNCPPGMALSETFTLAAVRELLSFPGAAYLRAYYGMKDENSIHAILVVADAGGNDLLPAEGLAADDDPPVLEDGFRCPDFCPPDSPLAGA
ncbi:MAG TPA: hypothetical protein VG738_23125 [Chitinophagaceae bacterium]|nr:hypothetical protein [Chitinophagaceae bacterium]